MAISFPRPLPDVRFKWCRFELSDPIKASPSGGGLINYTRVGDPTWTIKYQTAPLRETQLAELMAWLQSLRGGLKSALVEQTTICRPAAHTGSADPSPAQQTGTLTSVTGGNVLAVSGVHSGLVLRPGDMLGLTASGKRGLCRVTEASGAGTTREITVEPPPRSYVAVNGAVVSFQSPKLIMRLVPDSVTVSDGPMPEVGFQMVESMA